jgi:hypothetical protein
MWLVTACYAPSAAPGAPCSSLGDCPTGLSCVRVDGELRCVAGPVAIDAGGDAFVTDGAIDSSAPDGLGPDAAPAAPWMLVQTRGAQAQDVTFQATTQGNLIVVAVQTGDNGAATAVTDNASSTYVAIAGSRSIYNGADLAVELWYAANANASATRITASAPTVYSVVMWEVANIASVAPLTATSKLDTQAASTTPLGAAITTTTPGEFVVSAIIVENNVTSIRQGNPFTNDHTTFGNGWAHLSSTSASVGTYQAQWNATAGVSCASSAAFRIGP